MIRSIICGTAALTVLTFVGTETIAQAKITHSTGLKPANYTHAQVKSIDEMAKENLLAEPFLPVKIAVGDSFQRAGGASDTISVTYKFMNINESSTPLTGGGVVKTGSRIRLSNGVLAQWGQTINHSSSTTFLQFKMGKTFVSILALPPKRMSNVQMVQIADSMSSIHALK